jgi:DNA mismatch repair protein MutL
MSKIHLLDESTANKIAAGEVVDRPSSVIKELIENAIDAASSKIEIEIMAGGTSFMRVTDNGSGMSREDAEISIMRHATSKITKVEDLMAINTLGFRGEALPTIAAVSKFSLTTRKQDEELATLLEVEGGKVCDVREAGAATGTTVKVEDLFFNTPARKKFLKTPVSEGSHINDIIVKQAIANPDIAFKFINNNKLAIATPGTGKLFDTLKSIYGAKVSKELLELSFKDDDIEITGFLSKPTIIRSSRQWQAYIVNNRIISSRSIAKAIDNAYHSMLPKSGYPLAVLKITLPPNSVDVNVHPQKSEIKFSDEGRLFKAVYKSVVDAIRTPDGLEEIAAPVQNIERHYEPMSFSMTGGAPAISPKFQMQNRLPEFSYEIPKTGSTHTFSEARQLMGGEKELPPQDFYRLPESKPSFVRESPAVYGGALQPLGQVDLCYIVASDGKGLYIVDQHAAHERILYDRFAAMTDKIPSQQLLVHEFLDFSAAECQLIQENQELWQKLGFSMEQSGPKSMRLKEIPTDIPETEAENIIREILAMLQSYKTTTPQEIRHACLATTACRAAIKAGDLLNIRQMQIVLDELSNTENPYTCPHGRPTIIKFAEDELAKMFKRT